MNFLEDSKAFESYRITDTHTHTYTYNAPPKLYTMPLREKLTMFLKNLRNKFPENWRQLSAYPPTPTSQYVVVT